MPDDNAERRRIFRELVPYFGTVQPASFFRDTSAVVKDINRIHTLIEGIYKPAGFIYPLSIASMLKSQYSDQLFHNPDRTWWMEYSPKAGGLDLAARPGRRAPAGRAASQLLYAGSNCARPADTPANPPASNGRWPRMGSERGWRLLLPHPVGDEVASDAAKPTGFQRRPGKYKKKCTANRQLSCCHPLKRNCHTDALKYRSP